MEMCNKIILIVSVMLMFLLECSKSIQCHTCAPIKMFENSKWRHSCDTFDRGNPNYTVNCPNSTMCSKKVYKWKYPSGLTELTERGCAKQVEVIQEFHVRSWRYVIHIREPYKEKCSRVSNQGQQPEYVECYCRGDHCNQAIHIEKSRLLMASVILVILLIS